jgi:hypothetical protein
MHAIIGPEDGSVIVERNVFYAKYGQGDALVDVIREFVNGVGQSMVTGPTRVLVDGTGTMFRVIWEMEYPDMKALAQAEAKQRKSYGQKKMQDWFAQMQPLVERGERELLQTVDL